MGYVFILITLLAGCVKGFCGKKAGGLVEKFSDSLLINIVRMSLCIVIGGILFFINIPPEEYLPEAKVLLITVISGISTAVFVTSWLLSVRKGAYMLVEISIMMGIVFVVIAGSIAFKEPISVLQIIGIVLLFAGVTFMNLYQNKSKGKLSVSAAAALLICGISSGITDFTQKVFVKTVGSDSVYTFQFYTYLFAGLTLTLLFIFFRIYEKKHIPEQQASQAGTDLQETPKNGSFLKTHKKVFVYIPIMSVCLYINSYFKTLAAGLLPSAVLYPLLQGLSLIASTIMAAVFFKEKPTKAAIAGIAAAFVAMLLIKS